MIHPRTLTRGLAAVAAAALALALWQQPLAAQEAFTPAAEQVNKKMVKLFGAGGFKGLPAYGTGILVSKEGHILTVNNHILGTTDLKVHLYDGRIYQAKVIAREPELDVAMLRIEDVSFLPFFDIPKIAKQPMGETGDWILAFSNQFKIAQRNEPMSVQRGVVAAHSDLRSQRGFFDAPYMGDVYFIDTVMCNPGAAGGIVTTMDGRLLGIIGRELKHTLTDTWINYAVPIQAKANIVRENPKSGQLEKATVDIPTFVKEVLEGKYVQSSGKQRDLDAVGGFHGIVLVPNSVTVTPPYIDEVLPGSPAAEKGLRPDDLIVYIDGEAVPSIRTFRDIIRNTRPGMEIVLEVQRGERLETIKLKLAEQPKKK